MKKVLFIAFVFIVWFAIIYGLISFYMLDINPKAWGKDIRGALAFFYIMTSIFVFLVADNLYEEL